MDKETRVRSLATRDRRQPRLYGRPQTRSYGSIIHADKFGTDLCLRSKAPPPVAEYDAWLKGQRNVRCGSWIHQGSKTGAKLRRIVIMRRSGSTWKECGEAVGVSPGCARDWVEFLPMDLAV